jgi:hypothetical protein
MKYINCNSSLSKIDDPSCRTDFRVHVADVNRVSPFAQKGASGKEAPNILLRDAEHLEHSPFGRRTSMRFIQISPSPLLRQRKTCTTDIYAPLNSAGRVDRNELINKYMQSGGSYQCRNWTKMLAPRWLANWLIVALFCVWQPARIGDFLPRFWRPWWRLRL